MKTKKPIEIMRRGGHLLLLKILILILGCGTSNPIQSPIDNNPVSIEEYLEAPSAPSLNLDHRYQVFMDDDSYVYDGDSIKDAKVVIYKIPNPESNQILWPDIEIENNQIILTVDLRLFGIDTPEIRRNSKLSKACQETEVALGKRARDRVKELIGNEFFIRVYEDKSKYGDYLVRVYQEENSRISVNSILITENWQLVMMDLKKLTIGVIIN